MPYIDRDRRADLAAVPLDEIGWTVKTAGELNYVLTRIAIDFIARRGLSYGNANQVIGAFSSAQAEFYRRLVAPYEDQKIEENGDVY